MNENIIQNTETELIVAKIHNNQTRLRAMKKKKENLEKEIKNLEQKIQRQEEFLKQPRFEIHSIE